MDAALVFSTSPESVSARHLRADPRATVHLEGEHVAVVEGEVSPLEAAPPGFVEAYEAKYGWRVDPSDPGTPLFVAASAHGAELGRGELAATMTRWTFG